ncbi:MAG: cupin domain-containing protein [Betaproteobacteria bacterium]|nr:cupin domain-containing protein [Betaproteobacteria bacterium]
MLICTKISLVVALAALAGCDTVMHGNAGQGDGSHHAMAAASGVARVDGGKGALEHRIVPLRPMSGDVELLYGDPEVAGEPFVMRIRELPGAIVPPHSHPVDEHITVVQGTWHFALGSEFKPEALQELKAGGYAFAPKGSWMFGFSPDGAIVQVHGVGPFRIHWHGGLHTLDDADAKSVFHFSKGARVVSQARRGEILQGYASGKIIQYEIEGPSGERFMANEHELRLQ